MVLLGLLMREDETRAAVVQPGLVLGVVWRTKAPDVDFFTRLAVGLALHKPACSSVLLI